MFGWFFGKKEAEKIKSETKKGFETVKKDMLSITEWIKHLDSEKNVQKKDIMELKDFLSSIKDDLEGLKNIVSILSEVKISEKSSTSKQLSNKQTAVYAVQTPVQTAVQTPKLSNFSVTERAIVWVLLNTDMKLSYDDLAAMLGKERSTIRSQVNNIKQKSESMLKEVVEKNGKKRVYIPEDVREKLLKSGKVRVKKEKKGEEKDK